MQANNSDRSAKSRIVSASFVEHRLRVILTLYKGTFASGSNSTVIDDLAISAKIQKLPVPDFGKASIEITNMPLDDMEKLTTLAFHPLYQKVTTCTATLKYLRAILCAPRRTLTARRM